MRDMPAASTRPASRAGSEFGIQTDPLLLPCDDIAFKTGSASEYHNALEPWSRAQKERFVYEEIFFDLPRTRNVGSRGFRSKHKTCYGTPSSHESKFDAFDHCGSSPPCTHSARCQAAHKNR